MQDFWTKFLFVGGGDPVLLPVQCKPIVYSCSKHVVSYLLITLFPCWFDWMMHTIYFFTSCPTVKSHWFYWLILKDKYRLNKKKKWFSSLLAIRKKRFCSVWWNVYTEKQEIQFCCFNIIWILKLTYLLTVTFDFCNFVFLQSFRRNKRMVL